MDLLKITGRRFKIKYRDIQSYIDRVDLRDVRLRTIEGFIDNFNPNAEVVVNGEDGFYVLWYKSIVQMEEVK